MIQFRCWYCNRLHTRPEADVGQTFPCGCQCRLRVPSRSGGNCRVYTLVDFLVEAVVYGGGGALLGFGLALVILARFRWIVPPLVFDWALLTALPLVGFLAGTAFGERGVNWVGRMIRRQEDHLR